MPKAVRGVLLICDPPQMAMILKLNKESNSGYVIEEIDDRTCLVKENKVDELKRNVKMLMDTAMGVDDNEEDLDHDSDLD